MLKDVFKLLKVRTYVLPVYTFLTALYQVIIIIIIIISSSSSSSSIYLNIQVF